MLLGDNPYLGRIRNDLRAGLRSFPVGQYVVIYRLEGNKDAAVLRILRGSRDIGRLFGR